MEVYLKNTINDMIQKNDILSLGKNNKLFVSIDTFLFIINIYYYSDKKVYHLNFTYKKNKPYFIKYNKIKDIYIKQDISQVINILDIIMNQFIYPATSFIYINIKGKNNFNIVQKNLNLRFLPNFNTENNIKYFFFNNKIESYMRNSLQFITSTINYELFDLNS